MFAASVYNLILPGLTMDGAEFSSLARVLLVLVGILAGAMIFLVVLELIPHALDTERPPIIAWSFLVGFFLMILVQVVL